MLYSEKYLLYLAKNNKNKIYQSNIMLRETLQTAITEALTSGNTKEGMNGVSSWKGSEALAAFIVLIIIIIFILIIGKFLWNVVLCRLLTIAKPADSIWQILGLAILLNLIYA
jgi:hypothetical protein